MYFILKPRVEDVAHPEYDHREHTEADIDFSEDGTEISYRVEGIPLSAESPGESIGTLVTVFFDDDLSGPVELGPGVGDLLAVADSGPIVISFDEAIVYEQNFTLNTLVE